MAASWLKNRQTKYAGYVTAYILVILAVLAAVNFLANRYDKSLDTTSNKQFSLSDQTIKIARGLKQPVNVVYFGDTGSFPSAKDLLDRYSSLSPEIHVEYIDPVRKPQVAKSAGDRSDSPIVVSAGTRKEGAKSLTEEELTGAMIRSLKTGERNVCFLNAGNEHSLDDEGANGYSLLKKLLERDNYKVSTENLKPAGLEAGKQVNINQAAAPGSVEVPKSCTVLVIGGPQLAYPQPVVNAIKSYVEGGGHALIMLDTPLRIGRSEPAADNVELNKVLEDWGITMNKDLVLDLSGLGQMLGLGPEVPMILQYESHPITQPLTRVPTAWPLTRSIEVKTGGKTSVNKLVSTTEDSVAVSEVPGNGEIDPKKGRKGPLTIAAVGTITGANPGRFVVTGTSMWAQNSLAGSRSLGNRDLFVNIVNWLSSDEDLISIRPKETQERPLNMSTQKLSALFWLSIVIFPLGVVGFGMATWWKRR